MEKISTWFHFLRNETIITTERSHRNTQLLTDPIGESFPDLPHTSANAHLYDTGMVVVSQKLGRKCTVPTGYITRKQLWASG